MHFFSFFHFFKHLPGHLDPKYYTWLERYRCEDSHGKILDFFPVTILATDFCQHFGSQIIIPPETLY